jgi:hypothetical protein
MSPYLLYQIILMLKTRNMAMLRCCAVMHVSDNFRVVGNCRPSSVNCTQLLITKLNNY